MKNVIKRKNLSNLSDYEIIDYLNSAFINCAGVFVGSVLSVLILSLIYTLIITIYL